MNACIFVSYVYFPLDLARSCLNHLLLSTQRWLTTLPQVRYTLSAVYASPDVPLISLQPLSASRCTDAGPILRYSRRINHAPLLLVTSKDPFSAERAHASLTLRYDPFSQNNMVSSSSP